MIEMIELFNVERTRAPARRRSRIGIGIATGEMVAGYTGTQQRATYTCIGDTVNLAARLEAHTKVAQRAILVDAATRAGARRRAARSSALGPVRVQGQGRAGRGVRAGRGQRRRFPGR